MNRKNLLVSALWNAGRQTVSFPSSMIQTFPGDMGYALSEDALEGNFGEGAETDFETFGFTLPNRSYNAPMIMEQDSSCIRIARIQSSQDIDEQSAIDTSDLSGKLTYTVYSYSKTA
jgi:hypothetical protein